MSIQDQAVELADELYRKGIREVGGNNKGKWPELFLRYTGLGQGYPWCAAFVSYVLGQSGFTKFKSAAVISWRNWGKSNGLIHKAPKIGDLAFYLNSNGTGHIGIVVSVNGQSVITIEGNTSSGEGNQRDGDGVYRRVRSVSFWANKGGFIRWYEYALPVTVSEYEYPILKIGSIGKAVKTWQKVVGVKQDGEFGKITRAWTMSWQGDHDLEADGIVGPKTWAKAKELGAL